MRRAVADRAEEGVVLLGGRAGQRLEPVRVVGRALLERPVLHRRGHLVGERRRRAARRDRSSAWSLLEDVLRQPLALLDSGPKTLSPNWSRRGSSGRWGRWRSRSGSTGRRARSSVGSCWPSGCQVPPAWLGKRRRAACEHTRAACARSAPETRRTAASAPYPAVQHRAGAGSPVRTGARPTGWRTRHPIFRHSSNDARAAVAQTATPHLDSGGFMRRSLRSAFWARACWHHWWSPAAASADSWQCRQPAGFGRDQHDVGDRRRRVS